MRWQCVRVRADRRVVSVEDSYCVREISSPRPPSSVPCQGQCEGIQWQYGPWSACSQSCGRGGSQTRQPTCYDQLAAQPVEKEKCELKGPALVRRDCEAGVCPRWEAGEWSACSVSCGEGASVREVSCHKDEVRVETSQCSGLEKPPSTKVCSAGGQCGVWRSGDWSVCSSDCGPGVRTRTTHCVPPGHCSHHTRPVNTSTCVVLSCDHNTDHKTDQPQQRAEAVDRKVRARLGKGRARYSHRPHLPRYRWKIGRWSDCGSRCGGRKSRVVACYDRVRGRLEPDQARCGAVRRRPRETQQCGAVLQCQQSGWRTGQWSQCSSSCGAGLRWRRVECLHQRTGEQLEAEYCSHQTQPEAEERCEGGSVCSNPVLQAQAAVVESERGQTHWRTGEWSQCSATCGGGLRTRQVECLSLQDCSQERQSQPHSKDSCNLQPCPVWNTGQWGGCDQMCEGGRSRRLVRCQDHLGQTLPDQDCSSQSRPADSRTCNHQVCTTGPRARASRRKYLWRVGQWGQVTSPGTTAPLYLTLTFSAPRPVGKERSSAWCNV